jgi:hypothetical protein
MPEWDMREELPPQEENSLAVQGENYGFVFKAPESDELGTVTKVLENGDTEELEYQGAILRDGGTQVIQVGEESYETLVVPAPEQPAGYADAGPVRLRQRPYVTREDVILESELKSGKLHGDQTELEQGRFATVGQEDAVDYEMELVNYAVVT